MVGLLCHLLAIAILPFAVTVLVPVWIAQRFAIALELGRSTGLLALQLAGFASVALGLLLFVASLRRFATEGRWAVYARERPGRLVA